MPVLIISSSLLGAAGTIRQSLVQPLVLHLGGTMTIVGILTSLSGLSIFVPMLVFGEYSDTVGRRRPMLIASILLIGAGIMFWTANYWVLLIPAILMAGIAIALEDPAHSAATAESVPDNQLGRAFAFQNAGWLLAGVVATLLAIIMIDRGNLQSSFFLFTIVMVVNFGIVYFWLNEPLQSPRPASPTRILQNLRRNWRPPEKLKSLYFYNAVLDPIAFDTGWLLIYALLTEFQGATSQQLLLYTVLNLLAGGLLQLSGVAGRLVDWNRKWGLVLGDAIAVPTIFVCALFPSEKIFLIGFTLMGLAGGFFMPAIQAYVIDRVPRDRVGAELGKFWSSRGIAGLFPPILGAFLAVTYGYRAPLLFNVLIGAVALSFIIWKL